MEHSRQDWVRLALILKITSLWSVISKTFKLLEFRKPWIALGKLNFMFSLGFVTSNGVNFSFRMEFQIFGEKNDASI